MIGLDTDQLEECAEKLRIYDVDQKGWEHEPKGAKFNLHHVATHSGKDLVNKKFDLKSDVRHKIAPDSLAYALRLMRWTRQSSDRIPQEGDMFVRSWLTTTKLHPTNRALNAFVAGVGRLSEYLHDTDHPNSRKKTQLNRDEMIAQAAGLWVISAEIQASEFEFDLVEAFDERLDDLRERFDIPKPQAS